MKQVLFATGNKTKAKRFSASLFEKGIEVLTLADINVQLDVDEKGADAIANALIKARAYYEKTGLTVMAMDDNLYLENVPDEKQPGMFVRRVNGKTLTDDEMLEYYIKLVKDYGTDGRLSAKWVYGMAIIKDGKERTYTWSLDSFYLVDTPSDKIRPGYPLDTISVNKKLGKYFTDMVEDKQLIEQDENDVVEFIASNV